VAAPVLVFWPSRGVHRDSAWYGGGVARACEFFAEARIRISGYGACALRHRFPGLSGVGPSHVCERHESLLGPHLFLADNFNRVPSAIKTFNWLGTLWGGKIQFHTPMLFAIGFRFILRYRRTLGDISGAPAVDTMLHATYYVVGHFHIVMGVAAIFGIFAATYYWFPKMFGRSMDEGLGKLHFWLTFTGVYCIFMPMHFLGVAGGIRRYADSTGPSYLAALQPVHEFMTIAAFATAAAQLIFFWNFFRSLTRGAPASANPWNATTLEWATTSPPPRDNFGGQFPSVYRVPTNTACRAKQQTFCPRTSRRKERCARARAEPEKSRSGPI